MNTTPSRNWVSSATHGVFHLGCSEPKAGGRKRSSPATNGSRATAARYAPAAPILLSAIKNAAKGSTPGNPTRDAVDETACQNPYSVLPALEGSARSPQIVPRM